MAAGIQPNNVSSTVIDAALRVRRRILPPLRYDEAPLAEPVRIDAIRCPGLKL